MCRILDVEALCGEQRGLRRGANLLIDRAVDAFRSGKDEEAHFLRSLARKLGLEADKVKIKIEEKGKEEPTWDSLAEEIVRLGGWGEESEGDEEEGENDA